MTVTHAAQVDQTFRSAVGAMTAGLPRFDLDAPVRDDSALTARRAVALFEAQIESRHLDLLARSLRAKGQSYYTIGSSGHEGNAAVAAALRPTDPAYLHYRSGAFFLARAQQVPGPVGAIDVLLGCVASADEPISGGRHKVFGSTYLAIPPQTSTIASHLPKAVGCAVSLDRAAHIARQPERRIVVCSFGDASANHASATTALNAASWSSHQRVPTPLLFVCEDNGLGISVRTPKNWIATSRSGRYGIRYFQGNGLDLPDAFDAALAAAAHVRRLRRPAFLRLRAVRLLGHAGSDVEQSYRTPAEIASDALDDPLLWTAKLLIGEGWLTPDQVLELYHRTGERLAALTKEALARPKLTTRAQVMAPLFQHDPSQVAAGIPMASEQARLAHFGTLPEHNPRLRHLAFQLNRALADALLAIPKAIVFGEDVARKGGVYNVTAKLSEQFGLGRVFNTLLDETSILGLAGGASQAGLFPIPEIQYLAYLMNAIDQLRGEAGSLQFFSNGQYSNPMVVRIAGFAYQQGFGGHFHNDNGIAALREIPGILLASPSRGDDAVRIMRTLLAAALVHGRVCVMLEPIALYMTKDLHKPGDGGWLTAYPAPHEHLPVGEVGVYGHGTDVCIASYANGLYMSLRVAKRLAKRGIACRVIDLRWLAPLPIQAVMTHAQQTGKLLIVDECRRSSGIADTLAIEVVERSGGRIRTARVVAPDTYIPLGDAANLVLVQEPHIEAAALALVGAP